MSSVAFKDRSWDQRFEKMGDEAEGRFLAYAQEVLKLGVVRYGLDRPPLQMYRLPARVRYTPDYLMSTRFVEVQGLGRDQLFKLKLEKHGSLCWWADLHPVWFYVWDSHKQREAFFPLDMITAALGGGDAHMDVFPEGKAYFAIPADALFERAERGTP